MEGASGTSDLLIIGVCVVVGAFIIALIAVITLISNGEYRMALEIFDSFKSPLNTILGIYFGNKLIGRRATRV